MYYESICYKVNKKGEKKWNFSSPEEREGEKERESVVQLYRYNSRWLLSFRHYLKRRFCLAFYLKCFFFFVLIGYILSETICPLCFCVLFSNNNFKINITTKIIPTDAFSIMLI